MNWKTFLLHRLKPSFLIEKEKGERKEGREGGREESYPRKRGSSKTSQLPIGTEGFETAPGFSPPSPQTECLWGVGSDVCAGCQAQSKVKGMVAQEPQRAGQWAAEALAELPGPSPGQSRVVWNPVPGKQGPRGTFEFTNGIKSIYIFMTTGKFGLVDRNGEM